MIITEFEGGYTFQYYEKQAPGGSDFACLFRSDGKLVMYFEPEVALRHKWPHIERYLIAAIHLDREQLRRKGELE